MPGGEHTAHCGPILVKGWSVPGGASGSFGGAPGGGGSVQSGSRWAPGGDSFQTRLEQKSFVVATLFCFVISGRLHFNFRAFWMINLNNNQVLPQPLSL